MVSFWIWQQYRRAGVPFLYRPDGGHPATPLTRRLVALEWAALVLAVLIFSPQTNTRHYSLLVLIYCVATAALLHPYQRTPRWPLVAGMLVLFLASVLPIGSIHVSLARDAWGEAGGISWCALLLLLALVWFVLTDFPARSAPPLDQEAPTECRTASPAHEAA
jgi:hypothetical protein